MAGKGCLIRRQSKPCVMIHSSVCRTCTVRGSMHSCLRLCGRWNRLLWRGVKHAHAWRPEAGHAPLAETQPRAASLPLSPLCGAQPLEQPLGVICRHSPRLVDHPPVHPAGPMQACCACCRAPWLLTVHFKRFREDGRGRLAKLPGHIPFDFELDTSDFMDPEVRSHSVPSAAACPCSKSALQPHP